jgi:enoyl-CoA hydratase/carnithine racemase
MNYENIIIEKGTDFVASITFNRPQSLNTFNTALATEFNCALLELDAAQDVRVIILKGNGKAFCAGIDVSAFFGMDVMAYREWIECMERPLITMSTMKKPVIAQVHGVAAANGAGVVAAADLAIFSEKARIGLTAINVGLNCIGPVVPVARSLGRKRALEMLLFGDLYPASEALKMGLINRVVPEEELEAETRKWAATLAQKSPIALQIAKKAFYAAEDMDFKQAFEYMNEAFPRLCSTKDAAEGITSFLEKRMPVWKEE